MKIGGSKFSFDFQTDEGEDDLKKGTQLLEIYALEIQMYTVQKNNKKLKALYEQSLQIKSAIPHPLIMGVIRGKFPFFWLEIMSGSDLFASEMHALRVSLYYKSKKLQLCILFSKHREILAWYVKSSSFYPFNRLHLKVHQIVVIITTIILWLF